MNYSEIDMAMLELRDIKAFVSQMKEFGRPFQEYKMGPVAEDIFCLLAELAAFRQVVSVLKLDDGQLVAAIKNLRAFIGGTVDT